MKSRRNYWHPKTICVYSLKIENMNRRCYKSDLQNDVLLFRMESQMLLNISRKRLVVQADYLESVSLTFDMVFGNAESRF